MQVPLEITREAYAEALQACFWNISAHIDDFFWLASSSPCHWISLIPNKLMYIRRLPGGGSKQSVTTPNQVQNYSTYFN